MSVQYHRGRRDLAARVPWSIMDVGWIPRRERERRPATQHVARDSFRSQRINAMRRAAKMRKRLHAASKRGGARKWSRQVAQRSDALDLERGVFTADDPKRIARSLKRSAEASRRRKATPFQSAMSMLNLYINRAGRTLPAASRRVSSGRRLSCGSRSDARPLIAANLGADKDDQREHTPWARYSSRAPAD